MRIKTRLHNRMHRHSNNSPKRHLDSKYSTSVRHNPTFFKHIAYRERVSYMFGMNNLKHTLSEPLPV